MPKGVVARLLSPCTRAQIVVILISDLLFLNLDAKCALKSGRLGSPTAKQFCLPGTDGAVVFVDWWLLSDLLLRSQLHRWTDLSPINGSTPMVL